MTGKVENGGNGAMELRFIGAFALLICLVGLCATPALAQDETPPADVAETVTESVEAGDSSGDAEESTTEVEGAETAEPTSDSETEASEESTEEEGTVAETESEPIESESSDAETDAAELNETDSEPSESEAGENATTSSDDGDTSETDAESDANSAADADDAATEGEGDAIDGYLILGILAALFLIPMYLGNFFAKSLRMPDHGWKFAVALGTLAGAAIIYSFGEVKYGPDLSGGITLIYELQDSALRKQAAEAGEAGDESDVVAGSSDLSALMEETIGALQQRVDPSGTKEITIREYGAGQIEIIIPKAKPEDLKYIERKIYTAGALEFRITASENFRKHLDKIKKAKELSSGVNELIVGGEKVAEWVSYDVEHFRGDSDVVTRMAGEEPQVLVLTDDGQNVTGDFLSGATKSINQSGQAIVEFSFNAEGAQRFGRLTGAHLPVDGGSKYRLGIILDKQLKSAPSINSRITNSGQIDGIASEDEVDFLVEILKAGKLALSLSKEPIFRETISPTLGTETVRKGTMAISISLVAVMIFMLFYYRFAGFVACLALAANLLLILGLMVLFKAAFTLPGLAGLVLTIGMSVDANVLIFERIREERNRGAAMRMAIINGFARASQTIVDANVTTLITAMVIYKIAPDNVKGFGVTLILGIVMSMFSAIFLSRIVFDVFERTRSLTELSMVQIIRTSNIDFIGMRVVAGIFSLIVIGIGIFAVSNRGGDLLNIDFTGGSSVTMVFDDDQPLEYAEVKKALDETVLVTENLSLVEVGEQGSGLRYTVKSTNEDIGAVQTLLVETFGDRLKTYNVEIRDIASIAGELAVDKEDSTDATEEDSEETSEAITDPFAGGTVAVLEFTGDEAEEDPNNVGTGTSGVSYDTVSQMITDALKATDHSGAAWQVSNDNYRVGSVKRFDNWDVKLALPTDQAGEVWQELRSVTNSQPIFPLSNAIGSRVAGDLSSKAIAAILTSLLGIVAYIWFRFQGMIYGIAAVIALIHDVLVTLGFIGLSAYAVQYIPGLADALMIEKFQISLPIVAAFLTIIGYSLNDTIVVFDRIREVKGKSPNLTADMINTSINQTLSRTLLTSLTTFLSVILLYTLGGSGIHGFAFALVIGVIVGTYSSIFIASPALLWMSQLGESRQTSPTGSKAA